MELVLSIMVSVGLRIFNIPLPAMMPPSSGLAPVLENSSNLSPAVAVARLELQMIHRFSLTRAFSWLKVPTSTCTFKTLLRHYAEQSLTPRSLNVKLGPLRKGTGGLVSIVSYSRPSLMIIAPRTQFHVEKTWGQRSFNIVS